MLCAPLEKPIGARHANAYARIMASQDIETLVQALSLLPGLGPRSARRAVLHLLKKRETALIPLQRALEQVGERLSTCGICGNVDTSNPCGVCADTRRDARMLCVVEDVADLWALERSRLFPENSMCWAGGSPRWRACSPNLADRVTCSSAGSKRAALTKWCSP